MTNEFEKRGEETPAAYVARVRNVLPTWPEEVLIEWLHRHSGHADKYLFLDFRRFEFRRKKWATEQLPGIEAFSPGSVPYVGFVELYRADPVARKCDWLARHMLKDGTWNTPIVLLENPRGEFTDPSSNAVLQSPLHLLEGHVRLANLLGMIAKGQAAPSHDVWLVTISPES